MAGNDGDEIWTAYAKGVKPLRRIKADKALPVFSPPTPGPSPSPAGRSKPAIKSKETKIKAARADFRTPLDAKTERRLRQGSLAVEARLDLHGMYQDEAHQALDKFIAGQVKAGRRCLLIITGKGRGGEGVLRTALGGWLAASPHAAHILALRAAAIRHGGGGAFYVLLKRRKD